MKHRKRGVPLFVWVSEGRAAPLERNRVNLIVDIQSRIRAGKSPAYEQWAKIYNLKQMAAALQYLQEIITVKNNIDHLLGLTGGQKNKEMER